MPTPSEAFGKAVRELRVERGLSQEAAALEGGIDRSYLGHIERASKSPTVDMVFRVATALGAKPSELMRRAERLMDV